ncbi:MAG: hypothetical protein ABI359_08130 [Ginsengibacter sp.]
MKKIVTILICMLVVLSCNNPAPQDEENNKTDTLIAAKSSTTLNYELCFSKMEKDTIFLQMAVHDSVVSGNLNYRLFEKDANSGKIKGKLYSDTLIADYTFKSEGIESVRQVVFLIKDSIATEGFGEMREENGRLIFTNVHDLNFQNGLILKKTDCTNNKE